MKDGDDIHEHVRKFSDKIYELNEMEINRDVDLQVWMFLFSLPRCFENFRRAIESRNYLPSPETLCTEIIEESDAHKRNWGLDAKHDAYAQTIDGKNGKG